MRCQICDTPLLHLDEACPNCLPDMAERPPTITTPAQLSALSGQFEKNWKENFETLQSEPPETETSKHAEFGRLVVEPPKPSREAGLKGITTSEMLNEVLKIANIMHALVEKHSPAALEGKEQP